MTTSAAVHPAGSAVSTTERRILVIATALFAVVQVLLLWGAIAPSSLIEADALTFHRMALQFLDTGGFAEGQRQPLYPLLMTATIRFAGEAGLDLLMGVQVVLLYLTGVVAWRMAHDWLGAGSGAVFVLVILNPNAVAVAHWPLADTLHALLFTSGVWALLVYGRRGGLWRALACGLALGLAALTRPETQYLVYLLPVAIPLVAGLARRIPALVPGIIAGVAVLAMAFAVGLPWMLYNQSAGDGLGFSSGAKAAENARGHYAIVESERTGFPRREVIVRLSDEESALLAAAGLADAKPRARRDYLVSHYLGRIFSSDPDVILRLYARAWVAQFASGGAQSLNRLLGTELERPDRILNAAGGVAVFLESLRGQPAAGAAVTLLAVGFAIMLRALGLAGLTVMAVRRHWPLLLVIAAVLAFKGAIHFFYGLARYRLSVEPLLMILAVYGWQGLWAAIPRRR